MSVREKVKETSATAVESLLSSYGFKIIRQPTIADEEDALVIKNLKELFEQKLPSLLKEVEHVPSGWSKAVHQYIPDLTTRHTSVYAALRVTKVDKDTIVVEGFKACCTDNAWIEYDQPSVIEAEKKLSKKKEPTSEYKEEVSSQISKNLAKIMKSLREVEEPVTKLSKLREAEYHALNMFYTSKEVQNLLKKTFIAYSSSSNQEVKTNIVICRDLDGKAYGIKWTGTFFYPTINGKIVSTVRDLEQWVEKVKTKIKTDAPSK